MVTTPVAGKIPVTSSDGNGNFTRGSVSWNPNHNPFQNSTRYTATITLTANNGYTFNGMTSATINGNTATIVSNL